MLVTTSILIKTDGGREALAGHRHDMQMRQRHLLILIDGARTVGQLHQLLCDWSDLDELLAGLQQAGMVDQRRDLSGETDAVGETFDPITHFNRPLLDCETDNERAPLSRVCDELPPLTGMTLGIQVSTAPVDGPAANDANDANPPTPTPTPTPTPAPALTVPQLHAPAELADVLPNVLKVELMRLALQHFNSAAGAVMPLLRACKEDPQSLCNVIAACAKAVAPMAGEQAAAQFVDAAMHAMAQRR